MSTRDTRLYSRVRDASVAFQLSGLSAVVWHTGRVPAPAHGTVRKTDEILAVTRFILIVFVLRSLLSELCLVYRPWNSRFLSLNCMVYLVRFYPGFGFIFASMLFITFSPTYLPTVNHGILYNFSILSIEISYKTPNHMYLPI